MKILIIQPGIGPYRVDFLNQLATRCDLKIVYFFEDATGQRFPEPLSSKLNNCEVERLDGGFNIRRHYPVRPRLGKVIREFAPDIVVGYEYNTLAMHLVVLKTLFKARWKLFIWTSDNLEIARTCKFPRSFFRKLVCRFTDGMLLYSDEVKEFYERSLIPEKEGLVLPNIQSSPGIRNKINAAAGLLDGIIEKFDLANKKIFIYVGRFHQVKNLPALIKAWKRAGEALADCKLIMVGGGEDEPRLRELIEKSGLNDEIIMTGPCYDDNLWVWYGVADYMVLPSLFEPYGAVVNEALAAGVPCLVSQNAGATVLITSNRQGMSFYPESIDDITSKLVMAANSLKTGEKKYLPPSLMPHELDEYIENFLNYCHREKPMEKTL